MFDEKLEWMESERFYSSFVYNQIFNLPIDGSAVINLGGESIYKFRASMNSILSKGQLGNRKFKTKKSHGGSAYWIKRIA